VSTLSSIQKVNSDGKLVVAIPIWLIWKVRVPWSQKLLLGCTLCLTILLAAATAVRVSRIKYGNVIDVQWECYWVLISAELGLILTASATFRTFFIARGDSRATMQSLGGNVTWYDRGLVCIKRAVTNISRSGPRNSQLNNTNNNPAEESINLRSTPGSYHTSSSSRYLTPEGNEMTMLGSSCHIQSHADQHDEEAWPLPNYPMTIMVAHDIEVHSTHVRTRIYRWQIQPMLRHWS
jgi:hypothetical protein